MLVDKHIFSFLTDSFGEQLSTQPFTLSEEQRPLPRLLQNSDQSQNQPQMDVVVKSIISGR